MDRLIAKDYIRQRVRKNGCWFTDKAYEQANTILTNFLDDLIYRASQNCLKAKRRKMLDYDLLAGLEAHQDYYIMDKMSELTGKIKNDMDSIEKQYRGFYDRRDQKVANE